MRDFASMHRTTRVLWFISERFIMVPSARGEVFHETLVGRKVTLMDGQWTEMAKRSKKALLLLLHEQLLELSTGGQKI